MGNLYVLIHGSDEVIREEVFPDAPPVLALEKGLRWVLDVPADPVPEGEVQVSLDAVITDAERRWVRVTRPLTVDERRPDALARINAERDRRLAQGAPYGGKLIEVSDKGRADLAGMTVAAVLALAGTIPWVEGYSTGWITKDNTRIPLATPADGIALAATVADWYSRTVQHAHDLKDAVLMAQDPDAIDHTAGWP